MDGSFVPDERPIFFKIMLSTLCSDPLHRALGRIPPQFQKRLSKEARQNVTLSGPLNKSWQVKIVRDEKDLYFGEGWNRFVRDNSLGDGEFLVFAYGGATGFQVQIFDRNRLERVYDNSGQEEVGESSKHKSTKKKKQNQGTWIKEEEEEMEQTHLSQLNTNPEKITNKKAKAKNTDPPAAPATFKSNLPYFWIKMGVNHVEKVFMLHIPSSFSRTHLPERNTEITLQNPGGDSWKVNCNYRPNRNILCRGWNAFARDNKLKTGDMCIFELVGPSNMQVHIFPSENEF